MVSFRSIIASLEAEGYANGPAQAKLAHDVILKALEKCGFGKNVTVKGGVVMSTITGDIRRATMDMDIDFVNYSLSNAKIDVLVKKLNCIEGVSIARQGAIVELRQQHYRGKRIFLRISDAEKVTVVTKIDIGVHTYAEMLQRNLKNAGARLCGDSEAAGTSAPVGDLSSQTRREQGELAASRSEGSVNAHPGFPQGNVTGGTGKIRIVPRNGK